MLSGVSEETSNDSGNDGKMNGDDAVVLKSAIELSTPYKESIHGEYIYSGAQMTTIGFGQARIYCKEHGEIIRKGKSKQTYQFGNKKYDNIGTVNIRAPVMKSHIINIDVAVVGVNGPFLLRLKNLTKPKIMLHVGNDQIFSANMNWKIPVVRKHGHLYVEWSKYVMFTVRELRRIHRHLFHSQLGCIYQLLRWAALKGTTPEDLRNLKIITRKCDIFQLLKGAPSRFRVALPPTDCVCNRCVCIDLMNLRWRTILHAVGRDTKFSVSQFMPN